MFFVRDKADADFDLGEGRASDSRPANALEWLRIDSANSTKTLGELNNAKSIVLVTPFYDVGVVDLLAVDIDEDRKGNENADKLVIVLPTDQEQHQTTRKLCACKGLQFTLRMKPVFPLLPTGAVAARKRQIGQWVISQRFNVPMLAEAVCKLEGFQ